MRRQCGWIVVLLLFVGVGCEKSDTSGRRSSDESAKPRARAWVKREFLEKASDEQLEPVLLGCLRNAIGGDYEHEVEIVRSWTPGKRMLYTTSNLESEVNNGGFAQYFENTQGKFSQMALEGLQVIGADRHAALMGRAIRIYEEEARQHSQQPTSDDPEAIEGGEKDSALNRLDDQFFDLTEDLSALRIKFIRGHLDEFATPS